LSNLTVEYWIDDDWYVGKLKEIPGVFSQGETIEELIENLKDAYYLILKENQYIPVKDFKTVEININL
jgi:predicted RNase H-like HicB family nuclease